MTFGPGAIAPVTPCWGHAATRVTEVSEVPQTREGGAGGESVGPVVVGVDGSEPSRQALAWAVQEARRRNATLQVVHAWSYPASAGYAPLPLASFADQASQVLSDAMGQVAELDPGVSAKGETRQEPAATALIELSEGADLLVVGSRGRGGFAGLLLGSVSQQCAAHAHCPVVVVRAHHP